MKVSVETWKISKLVKLRDQINPQPEYQRGEVWKDPKKRLLIDSILRGIDIPKIYLRKLKNSAYQYEVADGQQRIASILKFFDNDIRLEDKILNGLNLSKINRHDVGGATFAELPDDLNTAYKNYELTIAIVENATNSEIRTLFGRLQLGSQLNPAEKRNAIISSVGDHIDTFALNHKFFLKSRISKERYKHQDYLAHVFTLIEYDNSYDLKAEALLKLYLDDKVSITQAKLKKIDKVLDAMYEIDHAGSERLVNKFAFIDIFWLLFESCDRWSSVDSKGFSDEFKIFEKERLHHSKNPKALLAKNKKTTKDRQLYDYIMAFNYSGSSTENVDVRNGVFKKIFSKFLTP